MMRKVAPWPGALSTSIRPPCAASTPWLIASPSPVPPPRLEQADADLEPVVQIDPLARRLVEAREAAQVLHDGRRALRAARHHGDDLACVGEELRDLGGRVSRRRLQPAAERRHAA